MRRVATWELDEALLSLRSSTNSGSSAPPNCLAFAYGSVALTARRPTLRHSFLVRQTLSTAASSQKAVHPITKMRCSSLATV